MDELKELFNVLKVKTLAAITNQEDTELVVVGKPLKKKKNEKKFKMATSYFR